MTEKTKDKIATAVFCALFFGTWFAICWFGFGYALESGGRP